MKQRLINYINSRSWVLKGIVTEKEAGNYDDHTNMVILKLQICINCAQGMLLHHLK